MEAVSADVRATSQSAPASAEPASVGSGGAQAVSAASSHSIRPPDPPAGGPAGPGGGKTPPPDEKFINNFKSMFASLPALKLDARVDLEGLATQLWADVAQSTADTAADMGQIASKVDAATGKSRTLLSKRGADGAVVGADDAFARAIAKARPLADSLKEMATQTQEARDLAAKGFAFWSGKPAKFAAKASGLASLEGSQLGGVFDYEDAKLPQTNMSLWGALSQAYAEWATEDMQGKDYKGYVGVGGDGEDSIYMSVEKWVVERRTQDARDAGVTVKDIQWTAVVPPAAEYTRAGQKGTTVDRVSKAYSPGESDVPGGPFATRDEAVRAMQAEHAKRTASLLEPAKAAAAPSAAAPSGAPGPT